MSEDQNSQNETKVSPMMLQWHACKKQAQNAVLFFRMGDFYEAFYDDAALLAREIELTLTKRQGIPMCGVPWHTAEGYIDKLVSKGYRIAIAEQTEDPKQAKGLVRREVVRIVTPGTVVNSSLLPDKANNYICAIVQVGNTFGLAFCDLTTGEFSVTEFFQVTDLLNDLYRIRPSETIVAEKCFTKQTEMFQHFEQLYKPMITVLEDWRFDHQLACGILGTHFKVQTLEGFGLQGKVAALNAAGALLSYLKDTLTLPVAHIQEISHYSAADYMVVDHVTLRHLELLENARGDGSTATLIHILDETQTAMGGRLLKAWLKRPLLDILEIEKRQGGLAALLAHAPVMHLLQDSLKSVRDLERLMMKISAAYCSPRDLVALRASLEALPSIQQAILELPGAMWELIRSHIRAEPEMTALLNRALVDEPPLRIGDAPVFREGFHAELDELLLLSQDSKTWLTDYQQKIRDQTGIKTLKVGFNRMFGYYIEVSRGQADRMPPEFDRKQTLVNAERYMTPELKEYELKILTAEERILRIETELFAHLRATLAQGYAAVMNTAKHIAILDCLKSLALVASKRNYCCPKFDSSKTLSISGGRHPVIEAVNTTERFIPNDLHLNDTEQRMHILTGPNMAGKSTYIRQAALIAIMAQMGSYVPAQNVQMGIIDQVFTRIGASDDLSRGQSTFMVEMTETANILHHATDRSLVILDEIGRGTSTYDGISIAWAVAEYLLLSEGKKAKTLFATHYWELTKLEEQIPGAVNFTVAVQEHGDHVVFLRKIIRGGTDKSYGIHVAQLAGMPPWVVGRAREILTHLEENSNRKSAFEPSKPRRTPPIKQRGLQPQAQDFQLFLSGFDSKKTT